jgi:integrase
VRRPRLDYESHATALDRNEVGALLVAAGLGTAAEHALISLRTLNGLRISEAFGADTQALGIEREHRALTVLRKGGKVVTIPLAPRTARAIDLAVGERVEGPIFRRADGQRMDRHAASLWGSITSAGSGQAAWRYSLIRPRRICVRRGTRVSGGDGTAAGLVGDRCSRARWGR